MLSRLSLRTILPPLRAFCTTTSQQKACSPYKVQPRKEKYVFRRRDRSKYKGNPNPTLTVILKEDVPKVGEKGTVVTVPRKFMRSVLVAGRLADYGIPENFEKWGIPIPQKTGSVIQQGTCDEVVAFLSEKNRQLMMRPRHDDQVFLTRHDVVFKMLNKWKIWVPVHKIRLVGCQGDDVITELGSYTAEITVSNDEIEPPVVVSIPLNVEKVERDPVEPGLLLEGEIPEGETLEGEILEEETLGEERSFDDFGTAGVDGENVAET